MQLSLSAFSFCILAGEPSPSQHGLSAQVEDAAKEWFTTGAQDKVNFEIDLMMAPGPLGMTWLSVCTVLLSSFALFC